SQENSPLTTSCCRSISTRGNRPDSNRSGRAPSAFRQHFTNHLVEFLEGEIDILHRVFRGYGTLLGRDRHKKYSLSYQGTTHGQVLLRIVLFGYVMEVSRWFRHEII